jgi:hypothetical protein
MGWTIIEQEETVGKEKIPVRCKNVRFFPIEKKGAIQGFGKLKFLLLQIVVQSDKGSELKLKLNASAGINHPHFIVAHRDTMEYPEIIVGSGKNKRRIPDTLASKQRKPGMKEVYDAKDFDTRASKLFGQSLKDEIVTLFAEKLAEVA